MDRSRFSSLERLEDRVAPAVLLNPRTVTYIDPDGDRVTVTTSKGTWDLATDFIFAPSGVGEQLQCIDLAGKTEFAGARITVSAKGQGDGFAHVGQVDARNIDLAAVIIDGDLGRIEAGDTIIRTTGLGRLDVRSMGVFGVDTQVPGQGSTFSEIVGPLGKWTVAGDFDSVTMNVESVRSVRIGGDILGLGSFSTGVINSTKDIGSVVIGGNLVGGEELQTGRITSFEGRIGSVKIGGSVIGGSEERSGRISAQSIGDIRIGGDLRGGAGSFSGSIDATFGIGSIRIGGDVIGATGDDSGEIICFDGRIGSVRIGGGVLGGAGLASALIAAESMGLVETGLTRSGNVVGGTGDFSGLITAGEIDKVIINGDLRGNTGANTGGVDASDGSLGRLVIKGSLIGGDVTGSADISRSGFVQAQEIGTITIRGDLEAGDVFGTGTIEDSGVIRSNHSIRSLTVDGSIIGKAGNPVIISAVGSARPGKTADVAIGSILVGGRLSDTNILAGYDVEGTPVNADAQINSIKVRGNVLSSNLVAGVTAGLDGFFGTADDAPIAGPNDQASVISRIGKIVIGGSVNGTVGGDDAFGFVANQIASLRIDGRPVALRPGPLNDTVPVPIAGTTGDVFVREV